MQERIENGAVTSLNGTINDSTTTVSVTDATVFSLTQFRIIINSEIMLVTSIAGNDLTVVRGAEGSVAAAHNDGATVAQIITRDGIRRYMRDWSPMFDDPNRVPYQLMNQAETELLVSDFSWVNQGGATAVDISSGGIIFTVPTSATENARMLVKTAPSAPYTLTVACIVSVKSAGTPHCGAVIRESSTGKFVTMSFNYETVDTKYAAYNYTNATTFSTNIKARETYLIHQPIWLRIEDDNTNHKFSMSNDGLHFIEYVTQGRIGHLMVAGGDQVGFYINNLNSADDMKVTLVAFVEE